MRIQAFCTGWYACGLWYRFYRRHEMCKPGGTTCFSLPTRRNEDATPGLVIHTDSRFSVFLWTGRGKSGGWVSSIDIRSFLLYGFVRMAGSEAINLPIRTKPSACLHPPLARQTAVRLQLRYRYGGVIIWLLKDAGFDRHNDRFWFGFHRLLF